MFPYQIGVNVRLPPLIRSRHEMYETRRIPYVSLELKHQVDPYKIGVRLL